MLKTPIMMGQEVWFKATYVDINSGAIVSMDDIKDGYVKVSGTRETHGTQYVNIENCYNTKDELVQALRSSFDEQVKQYCESIQSIIDLVKFCYEHNFSAEEYTDWEAKKAAQIRAKELLDLTLED